MRKLEYTTLETSLAVAHEKEQAYIGKSLKANTPPGSVIDTGLAGKIHYYSGLYAVEMLGLCIRKIASMRSSEILYPHRKSDIDFVLSFESDYIISGYSTNETIK